MHKKIFWVVGVLILIGLVSVIISKSESASTGAFSGGDSIKIGAILSETGAAASFGQMSHNGIELAVKEINAVGGIGGREVVVIYENDQTDPKAAAGAFHKLIGVNKVDAVIGSNFDFVTQPLLALARDNKTVLVPPAQPRIEGAFDTNSHAFVMMTDFSDIIRSVRSYLSETPYQQLGILRFESSFGESIQRTLNELQAELGKKPIIAETYKEIGNNDFRTQILKLKQAKVDLIFLDMVAIDPLTFVSQARQLGYEPKIITHVGIQDTLAIKGADAKMFEGIVVINWDVTTEEFADKFEKAYGVRPDKSANRAYDAVYVLAEAISKARTRDEIPRVMESQTFTTPNGVFGFNKDHAAALTEVEIQVVRDGKLVPWVK